MKIERACAVILGDELADSIIGDMGIRWAVIAAMCDATTDQDPEAIAAIREWNTHQEER